MSDGRPGPGDKVGEYLLETRLAGGPGLETWLARHHVLRVPAVVKLAFTGRAAAALHAAGVAQYALEHPAVVRVYGLNLDCDPPYFVTERVEGQSLAARLAAGPLPWPEAAPLFRALLDALQALHAAGIAHGNLKPGNVLLDGEGAVRLADFGAAPAPAGGEELLSGVFADADDGPPDPYRPPGGATDTGPSADLWAAGMILFEALTGRRPEGSEAPSDLVAGLPAAVDEAYRRACTRRERRFATATEMAAALFCEGPAAAPSPAVEEEGIRIVSASARCAACGRENRVEHAFCVGCGTRIGAPAPRKAEAPVCRACGKPRRPGHRFCPYCGKRA